MWRILNGFHKEIKMSFSPVGHTKFAPDWCFGLFKRHCPCSKIGCLFRLSTCLAHQMSHNLSGPTIASLLYPCMSGVYILIVTPSNSTEGDHEDAPFLIFKHKVFVKNTSSDDNEQCINLLQQPWSPTRREMPSIIIPKGLSLERRVYLHDKIREFCPEHVQDKVCPKPS